MAERKRGVQAPATHESISGADWYGHDISGQIYTQVAFNDLNLTIDQAVVIAAALGLDIRPE